MKFTRHGIGFTLGIIAILLFTAGCGTKPDKKPGTQAKIHEEHPEHGPHEGALVEWGGEDYHVEFTVDHDKKQTVVYILDGTAKKAAEVPAEKITKVTLNITNVEPELTLELKHDPKLSDAKGIAFVGTAEPLGKKMEFKGQVSGQVEGKSYSGKFEEKPHEHKDEKK